MSTVLIFSADGFDKLSEKFSALNVIYPTYYITYMRFCPAVVWIMKKFNNDYYYACNEMHFKRYEWSVENAHGTGDPN